MIKLLYITNSIYGSGGLERVLSVKSNFFIQNYGYEVHVIAYDNHFEKMYLLHPSLHLHLLSIKKQRIYSFLHFVMNVRRLIKQISPDVISICDDGFKGFLMPLFLNATCPIIYERHMPRVWGKSKIISLLLDKLVCILSRKFTKIVVLTDSNREEWRDLNNVVVISDPLSFFPSKQSSLKHKKIIAVGKITYFKGFIYLAQAWKLIAEKYPDWTVHVYGQKCEEYPEIQEFCRLNQLENSFFMHDPTPDIYNKYLDSSIYVLTSRFEGFGMVLIEAMSCGLPCISFDCPCGPRNIIRNGEDGFIVEHLNVENLASKLELLINDEALRIKLGEKARENVKRFDISSVCSQWNELFKQLMN